MQSLGNDFVVLNGVGAPISMTSEIARRLADRHFGVGCDQILLAEVGQQSDFRFRIFNRDGSEVEQCGNGARCFAHFLRQQQLTLADEISVETINAKMLLSHQANGDVEVEMGIPEFEPANIPLVAASESDQYDIQVADKEIAIGAVAIGNPHAVLLVEDVDSAPVAELGPLIESHQRFPARVNAGFMQIVSTGEIRLRVYERGVGETLGCGSGACAAAVIGAERGLLGDDVLVNLPGGSARVRWAGRGTPVYLSGPSTTVFTGSITV